MKQKKRISGGVDSAARTKETIHQARRLPAYRDSGYLPENLDSFLLTDKQRIELLAGTESQPSRKAPGKNRNNRRKL